MFKHYAVKDSKIFLHAALHGVYRDQEDAVYRANLRLTLACLLARYCEEDTAEVVSLAMMPDMYEKGYIAARDGMWVCSYIGFERVKSKWAKERGFHAVICARFISGDVVNQFEGTAHTIQFYF